jgi:hypothetical protein
MRGCISILPLGCSRESHSRPSHAAKMFRGYKEGGWLVGDSVKMRPLCERLTCVEGSVSLANYGIE